MTPEVGTVCEGLIVNLEHNVVYIKDFFQVCTVFKRRVKFHNTAVFVADAKLCFRAAHTLGNVACNLSLCDFKTGNTSANLCEGNFKAKSRIGCTAYTVVYSVTAINLEDEDANEQISMFFDYEEREKREKLNKVIDEIKREYGSAAIKPAIILDEDKMPSKEQGKVLPGKMHK